MNGILGTYFFTWPWISSVSKSIRHWESNYLNLDHFWRHFEILLQLIWAVPIHYQRLNFPKEHLGQCNLMQCLWCRVSVQGVKSFGGHFACLCREFDFYEVKKICYYISKRKEKYFCTFNHFYSEKSKIAQIYYYDPQSAGINVQSPQSESTPRRLTLLWCTESLQNWIVK